MRVTVAAQAVQISAYPDAYADDEALARRLLSDPGLTSASITSASFGGTSECAPGPTFPGRVVFPLPSGSGYADQANWGNAGAQWSTTHTGTDFSVACGTPVLAATNGTVIVRQDQPWSGEWLVQVSTGAGQLTTWYAHMQELRVDDGESVQAGQQIGEVGALGNATGCHLHFEVHPKGGSIYEDGVNPSEWLRRNIGREPPQIVPISSSTDGSVVLVTANIRYSVPAAAAESVILRLLAQQPDIVLLQEVAGRHLPGIIRSAPGEWAVWQPPGVRGESAIIWDRREFRALRKGATFGASLRGGRWLTWALLESSAGELPVVSLHMPSESTVDASQQADYLAMTRAYRELVADFVRADYAPVLGGDWNHPLDRVKRSWGPVSTLRSMGMTTNWRAAGAPCAGGTSEHGAHIDGFAFHPQAFSLSDHGCMARGPSDHRPVWVRLEAR
jgi:endonuclease/exonuclease/phosphatase family metal-dependent hydrolase